MKSPKKASVVARNLSVNLNNTPILRDINLSVAPGEFFVLLGPSGSGKTTLLRAIAGFQTQHDGEVLIDGLDVTHKPPNLRNVGMVFQNYALWPHLSVGDNVAFGLVEQRLARSDIAAKVSAMLSLVGLSGFAARLPSTLSGGQQQRVALARSLVVNPHVLLLDEPLSNLDKQFRVQMRQELRSLQRSLGLTTVLVTHDQEEAMTLADRMAVLDQGVLQQIGTPAGLFDFPRNRFVASFVGTANVLQGHIAEVNSEIVHFVAEGLGSMVVPRLPDTAHKIGSAAMSFRPHQVVLLAADTQVDASRVWLNGEVQGAEFMGEVSRYKVRVGELSLIVDQPHYSGLLMFPPGVKIRMGIDPTQVRFLVD